MSQAPQSFSPLEEPPLSNMSFEYFCATDTGRARNNNEDSVAIDEPSSLIVLADGMGGYNAGEVASGMATSFIKTELGRWLQEASSTASTPTCVAPWTSASTTPIARSSTPPIRILSTPAWVR